MARARGLQSRIWSVSEGPQRGSEGTFLTQNELWRASSGPPKELSGITFGHKRGSGDALGGSPKSLPGSLLGTKQAPRRLFGPPKQPSGITFRHKKRLWGDSSGPPKSPPGSLLGAKDNYSNETLTDCSFQGQYEFGDFDDLSGNDTLNSRKLAPEGARGKAPPGAPASAKSTRFRVRELSRGHGRVGRC